MKQGKNTEQSWSPACHNNNCIELVSDSPCQMAPSERHACSRGFQREASTSSSAGTNLSKLVDVIMISVFIFQNRRSVRRRSP